MGKNPWLRAKTNASSKPELKIKVVRNTCYKKLGSEIKSDNEKYLNKSSLVNFRKSIPFRKIYVKYLDKKQYSYRFRLYLYYLGVIQKVRSLQTSSFWSPFTPLVRSCLFYMYPSPSTDVRFSELQPPTPFPSSKIVPRRLRRLFWIKNWGVKREKRINLKDECFLHSYIYNDNTNIYMFIKKR